MQDEREPLKLRERAYDAFTQHLLARDIRPGQFVSQRELVELTGLPLGAIRELIPRLEAEGLIRTVPQRGMQIAHIDLQADPRRLPVPPLHGEGGGRRCSRAAPATPRCARCAPPTRTCCAAAGEGITPALIAEAQAIDWGLHDTIIDALGNEIISNAYRVNSIKIRLIREERMRILDTLLVSVMHEHMHPRRLRGPRPRSGGRAVEQHIGSSRARAIGIREAA